MGKLDLDEQQDLLSGAENIVRGKPYLLGKRSAAQLFWDNWYVRGFDARWNNLKEALSARNSDYYIHPWEIQWIGYQCLQRNEKQSSLEAFQYRVNLFPGNFDLLDGLGEAYLAVGDRAGAAILQRSPENQSQVRELVTGS